MECFHSFAQTFNSDNNSIKQQLNISNQIDAARFPTPSDFKDIEEVPETQQKEQAIVQRSVQDYGCFDGSH